MPFVSDEQRKAAFANMRRGGRNYTGRSNYGGQGRTTPKTPKTPKPKKPKKGTSPPAYGVGAVGYAGNYTSGAPSYANWYNSLPNTTAAPPTLAPSGGGMGGYGSIPAGSFNLTWEDYQGTGNRELTTAEKIGIGIPIAAAMWYAAPVLGAAAAGGLETATFSATTGSAAAFITATGTQGGALGYSALALTGLPMSINDSPYYYREGNVVKNRYPDLVGWIGGQVRNQKYIDYSVSSQGIDYNIR